VLFTVQLSVALDDVPIMWDPSCQANVIPAPPYGNSTRHQKDKQQDQLVSPNRIPAWQATHPPVGFICDASQPFFWLLFGFFVESLM
jgi:hypothetical protein